MGKYKDLSIVILCFFLVLFIIITISTKALNSDKKEVTILNNHFAYGDIFYQVDTPENKTLLLYDVKAKQMIVIELNKNTYQVNTYTKDAQATIQEVKEWEKVKKEMDNVLKNKEQDNDNKK